MKAKIYTLLAAFWMGWVMLTHLSAQPEDIISRHYSMKDGLPQDFVRSLLQDSQGFLWVGTGHGLDLFNPENQSFTHFLPERLQSDSLVPYFMCMLC